MALGGDQTIFIAVLLKKLIYYIHICKHVHHYRHSHFETFADQFRSWSASVTTGSSSASAIGSGSTCNAAVVVVFPYQSTIGGTYIDEYSTQWA